MHYPLDPISNCQIHYLDINQHFLLCRHDVIAQLSHAKRLAKKLHPYSRMVELPGGHLVSHERTEEVWLYILIMQIQNHPVIQNFILHSYQKQKRCTKGGGQEKHPKNLGRGYSSWWSQIGPINFLVVTNREFNMHNML